MFTTAPTPTVVDGRVTSAPPELDFTRTLDRTLVHRDALGEVFLTDTKLLATNRYLAAAQLPHSHAYYGDHLLRPLLYDPILLLEACRQAALAAAHRWFAVPTSHKFIITTHEIHITRPQMITLESRPCELVLDSRITERQHREGIITGLDHAIELSVSGITIGHAKIGMRHKSPESYQRLRSRNRNGAALLSTSTFHQPAPGAPVRPDLVGRTNPHNVLLANLVDDGHTVGAEMILPSEHPSMFDHPQDHLPGMVLTEAARQLAVYALTERFQLSAAKIFLTDLFAVFLCFGELEPTTRLEAVVEARHRPPAPTVISAAGLISTASPTSVPADGLAEAGGIGIDISITQDSTPICLVRATMHTLCQRYPVKASTT